jgi:hypothetical protein
MWHANMATTCKKSTWEPLVSRTAISFLPSSLSLSLAARWLAVTEEMGSQAPLGVRPHFAALSCNRRIRQERDKLRSVGNGVATTRKTIFYGVGLLFSLVKKCENR